MHRGSSKGATGPARAPEALPLSASPAPIVRLTIVHTRAGRADVSVLDVRAGTPVREALRHLGHAPEGCAVLDGERPLPLDHPIEESCRLTVIPTFSGG